MAGDRQHAALRRAVGGLLDERRAAVRGHRRRVDDHAAAARDQVRPRGAGDREDQIELVVEGEPPVLPRHLGERADPRRRGVVVEDVDAAGARRRAVDPGAAAAGVGQVDRRRATVISPPAATDLGRDRLGARRRRGRSRPRSRPRPRTGAPPRRPAPRRCPVISATLPASRPHHARSTSSTRLPSGSARKANRTPGSGDGAGLEHRGRAPAPSAAANTASMSGAASAK